MTRLSLILAVAYIALLPFGRLAVRVGRFGVTPADFAAAALALSLAARGRNLRLDTKFLPWLATLGVFVAVLLLSVARSGGGVHAALEALPFVHAFLMTVILALFLSEGSQSKMAVMRTAFQIAVLVCVLPFLFHSWLPCAPPMPAVYINIAGSYQFFFITTNQFAFFLLTALMATLALHRPVVPRDMLVFMIAGMGIMAGGSRSGLIVYLFLCAAFLMLPQRVMSGEVLPSGKSWACRLLFIAFLVWLVTARQNMGYGGARSVSVVEYAKKGEVADSFRKEQFRRVRAEAPRHLWFGMGLGGFLRTAKDGYELHNSFLALLTEAGLIGLLAFLALQGVIWRVVLASRRPRERKLAAMAALSGSLLYMCAQHVVRERWLWTLYALLVCSFAGEEKKAT